MPVLPNDIGTKTPSCQTDVFYFIIQRTGTQSIVLCHLISVSIRVQNCR